MTNAEALTVRCLDDDAALAALDDVAQVYGEVYREPPYFEGPDDVAAFIEDWPRRVSQPGFRLVTARSGVHLAGFAFGHQLDPQTKWWTGTMTPLNSKVTAEYPGRTFAIIELAVRQQFRRQGIAQQLHAALLADRAEERVTLLARPEAEAANRAYAKWGYRVVGQIKPGKHAPVYNALMRGIPL